MRGGCNGRVRGREGRGWARELRVGEQVGKTPKITMVATDN